MPLGYSNSLSLATPRLKDFEFRETQKSRIVNQNCLTKDAGMPHRDIDPSSYLAIGTRLSHLRRVLGFTQVEMAEKLGMTGPRWANYETGTSRIPVDEALKLVQMIGVSLDWIYYGNRAMLPLHLVEKIDAVAAEPVKKRVRSQARH